MTNEEKMTPNDGSTAQVALHAHLSEMVPHVGTLHAVLTRVDGTKEYFTGRNARVNAGASAQFANMFSGTQVAQFNYLALSSTAITPASGDTALSGEITGSGLARVQVTPSYTAPASVGATYSAVFTKTFTATASVNVNSCALLNASSSGTLFSEIAFSSQASLNANDSLSVTYTISQ